MRITRLSLVLCVTVAFSVAVLVFDHPLSASAAASSDSTVQSTVSRTTKAVNYRQAGGTTRIPFQGTDLMPGASGEAKVENKANHVQIDARFDGMQDSTKFGLEYLTYVLWAISSQGRAVNVGEIAVKNGVGTVKGVTDMQTFGMIVTAEPYYAVTQPGDEVVMENVLTKALSSHGEDISAKYEVLGRGSYASANTKIEDAVFGVDRSAPLELFQARNAVRIARNAQADKYATSSMSKADSQLKTAEDMYRDKKDKKRLIAAARNVVQTAEEARVIAVQKKSEEEAQLAADAERKAAAEREAKARADAAAETLRRQQADQARADADQARAQAEAAQADAERMRQQAEKAKQEADAARAAALAQQRAAEAEAEKARQAAAQAENEKSNLRAQLLQQLNSILQTEDTARGLIVNMSDVLFDTGSATLKPPTREKLAKISGILLAHPGLSLQVEGHTDSVGGDEFNQQLSERRADSVRDFLIQQGVSSSAITAKGFGKTQPVASNDSAEGRQKNRRVELVVNGESIGKGTPTAGATPPQQ